jgi:hypothetical protein
VRGARLTRLLAPGVLLLLAAVTPSAQAQAPTVERPTLVPGQRWVRTDGVYDLVRVENDRYVFVAALGVRREVHLTRDLAIARTQHGDNFNEMDPPVALAWPLRVGTWGLQRSIWRWERNHNGVPAQLTWKVAAYEDVTVPAGTFKAFRVEMNVELSAAWNKTFVAWYAPAARQWVKGGPGGMFRLDVFSVVSVDGETPLRIALTAPRDGQEIDGGEVRLSGKVSGSQLVRTEVSLNGAEVTRIPATAAEGVTLDVPLPLQPGKNTILVTAVERNGERRQESRMVERRSAAPAPSAVAPARPAVPEVPPDAPPTAPPPATASRPPATTPPPQTSVPPPPATAPAPAAITVSLASPAHRAKVDHDTIAMAGIVSAGRGVSRVIVSLNGQEVARQDETPPRPSAAVNVPLKLREGQNTVVVTVSDTTGALHQEIRSVEYDRPVPLSIALRYPEERSRTAEPVSVVAALVESSRGVARVQVLLNGAEVHAQAEREPEKSVVVTTPVTLRDGPNTVVIRATEAGGAVRQEMRTVILERVRAAAAPPPAPAAPPAPTRNQWAVVVGVGQYEHAAIPRLRYAVADAEAIYQTLTGPGGFKKDHVLLLTDRSERKPTLRNLKWALGTFLGRSAQKDDTVVIFFAGHGAPEVDTRGLERDGLAKYLIPSDADPDDLYATALPMDELQTIFGRIEAERVVAFLDTCYSGAAGGRTFVARKTRAASVDDLFLERLTRSKGRAIITASRPSEVSIELPELGHGIFSYYLVNGLGGAADLNRDGIVSLQELYEYVEQQVTAKARAVGGNQHPVMKGEMEGVLPLAKVRAR